MLNLHQHERQQLLKIMQKWLIIDWNPETSTHLLGGMSGTNVMRITPQLRMATHSSQYQLQGEHSEYRLPAFSSTIVKHGKFAPLAHEYAVYHQLPATHRRHFAQIITEPVAAEPRHGEPYAYLLLEDLADHCTLREFVSRCDRGLTNVQSNQLVAFLQQIYTMPRKGESTKNQLYKLYLGPMQQSLHALKMHSEYLLNFTAEYNELSTELAMISAHSHHFEPIPATIMHGDLNLNNVMVAGPGAKGMTNFRLIDLEKFSWDGDMAYDIGELIIALEQLWLTNQLSSAALDLAARLEQRFTSDATAQGDRTFAARLAFAKARSLLKLIELWVRRLLPQLQGQQSDTTQTAAQQSKQSAHLNPAPKLQANLSAVTQLLRRAHHQHPPTAGPAAQPVQWFGHRPGARCNGVVYS